MTVDARADCGADRRGRPGRQVLFVLMAILLLFGPAADPAQGIAPDTGREGQVLPTAPVEQRPDRASPRARWLWPLEPRPQVLARFEPPSTAYGPGHRGIDLAASPGQPVRAVAAGRVTFAGAIADKPAVAISHADGIRSTYEPVVATVLAGDDVVVGQVIGVVAPTGSHCAKGCVHLGAIRVSTYLDPLLMLGSWRVRLLPLSPPP